MATKLIRIGRVSAVNAVDCTARVLYDDEEGLVSGELPILTTASLGTRAYWLPEIDTQVLCLFLPNASGSGINQGYIIGAFYSSADRTPVTDEKVHTIHFNDGSTVTSDGAGNIEVAAPGNIRIKAAGDVTIQGANIRLN